VCSTNIPVETSDGGTRADRARLFKLTAIIAMADNARKIKAGEMTMRSLE
jgi:hypothetical protein